MRGFGRGFGKYGLLAGLLGVFVAGCGRPRSQTDAQEGSRFPGAQVELGAPTRYPPVSFDRLGYDATQSRHLDLIERSFPLAPEERKALSTNGFVISERRRFRSFAEGYIAIYAADLPLYVSADSILDAVHRSYDTVLESFERRVLSEELERLLTSMQARLQSGAARALGAQAERDVDEYIAVPLALLKDVDPGPIAGADASRISSLVEKADQAQGIFEEEMFGETRKVDWSQFKPRGHYQGKPDLERYFRAVMWLGRMDMRIVDYDAFGRAELSRRQLTAALALRTLLDPRNLERFRGIDQALRTFVGERDSMSFDEVDRLLRDLRAQNAALALRRSDAEWMSALSRGNYGKQRISSDVRKGGKGATRPLARSFSPLGQRYVVDSEVLSRVVYDRVIPKANMPERKLPDPLDVAYAALGNGYAKALLKEELDKYGYSDELDRARNDVDALPTQFWNGNLYNQWVLSLRALSPGMNSADGLPSLARTEPWARRILNTQLASWAELRHDTILYAKQSYTSQVICEFPDAYVDPYPEFYAALARFAQTGKRLARFAETAGDRAMTMLLDRYYDHLSGVVTMLGGMAERERRGEEFSKEQMDFINEAVQLKESGGGGCGGPRRVLTGWYTRLFVDPREALLYDPTIADVHSDSNDGKILHVGTGKPQLMVVTVDTCHGPSSYAGLAFSYYQEITSGMQRLTDSAWAAVVDQKTSPAWLKPITAR